MNDLSTLIPKILARGLLALRQEARMARLVNRAYETAAGKKGSTVTIPVSAAVAVTDVTPAATPPSTPDTTITEKQIVVDQWKEAAFHISDKEATEVNAREDFLPLQAAEAIKAIANFVDGKIWAEYKKVYGFAGTPGTTPFATDTTAYTATRKVLNDQLAPMDPRFMVINTDAEANALNLRAFQDASFSGSIDGIVNGQINNKLGARWMMSQNAVSHVTGAATAGTIAVDNGAGYAAGLKTVHMDGYSVAPSVGDILEFANHAGTYTVVSATALAGTDSDIVFEPGLREAVVDNEAVTFKASHDVNLLFHPMAFALVSKPFADEDSFGLGRFFSAVDTEVSGLALRLEVSREHKRTRFSYDILFGVATPRPELAARLAG